MVPALAACTNTIWPPPGRDEIIFDVKLSEISATWHVNLRLGLKLLSCRRFAIKYSLVGHVLSPYRNPIELEHKSDS